MRRGRRGYAVGARVRGRARAGSELESPRIISVKKMPIESTWAEFWKVWFMPPPAPRCCAGRLFITAARLGAAKAPIESPIRSRMAAKSG